QERGLLRARQGRRRENEPGHASHAASFRRHHTYAGTPRARSSRPRPDSFGFSTSVFATKARAVRVKTRGRTGKPQTRYGRGAGGRVRRSTTAAAPVAAWKRNPANIT